MVTVKAVIKSLLEGDGTVSGLLTGGVFTEREIKRTQAGAPPFDANGEIEPCGNIKEEADVPIRPHRHSHRMFVAIYLYERDGYASIQPAADRIYELLHRQKIGSSGDRIFEVFHSNTLSDLEDDVLDASLIVTRYEVVRGRA